MIYSNNPLYLLSLLGYIYYLTYYTLTTKDNINYFLQQQKYTFELIIQQIFNLRYSYFTKY